MTIRLLTHLTAAWGDVRIALKRHHIITTLGWQDVATRYRRSRVGAFWLTINVLVMIATLGFVFGTLFRQPMAEMLPYLAIGLIIWGFLSTLINEGCSSFIAAQETILQVRMPLFTHVMRVLWRNIIIMAHNLMILPLLFLLLMKPITPLALWALPGFMLLILNSAWLMLALAVACARFRDMTQIAQNGVQVMFYLTPIIWSTALLPAHAGTSLIDFNPFYHLINIVRAPLLGEAPSSLSWTVAILMALFGWTATLAFFGRYYKRIPYWL
jgi:ABC-type polysaccharide/polyol phosphate export permease